MSGRKNHRGWGWVRKRSSGRYQASYIGPDNVRHFAPTTFEHKIDAEEWLTAERREIESAKKALRGLHGLHGLHGAMTGAMAQGSVRLEWMSPTQRIAAADESFKSQRTLDDYAQEWIEDRDLTENSRIQYRANYEANIAPKLGSIIVGNLKQATVRSWYASLLRDKPTMRSQAYGLLKSICATAVRDELLDRNPCQIEGATVVKRKLDPVVPDIDELAVIADKIEPRFKAYVLLSAWCGLRFGEAIELRRRDIRYVDGLEPGVVMVERGFTHRKGCHVGLPKTGRTRNVPIPPHIRPAIDDHLATFVDTDPDALLFKPARVSTCHLSDSTVRVAFNQACKAAGVSGMRLHDMRHFSGHQTARVANLPETMARLGHTTQSASLRYQGMVSGRDVEIANQLSALATKS